MSEYAKRRIAHSVDDSKLFTLPRAKPRYAKIGFVDTDGSGEMILTQTNSEAFLESQQTRRNLQAFD